MTRRLTPEEWRRISPLLDDLLEASDEERKARLQEALGAEPLLMQAVERLLRADDDAHGFLEEPAPLRAEELLHPDDGGTGPAPAGDRSGTTVGSYRLVRLLGRGGMGEVYLAERAGGGFEQQVALKLVRQGEPGPGFLARFLRERQILARLDHPNIARLVDGGATESGLPWFAMERVEGASITAWCDLQRLDVPGRLRLFLEVCRAVHYAHQRLIVHRDLKPSNILVGEDGRVKLLDFGIASLLEPDQADAQGPLTREGVQILTPEYAAPEQILGEPATTATDVFGLGVILCELLAGRRPHQPRAGADRRRTEQAVLETRPLRPSALAVMTSLPDGGSSGPDPTEIARLRATTPERLRRMLRGDLDTVVLTAIRREPGRRYQGAGALAEDVERVLARLPIRARPDSLGYRASRFVSRHRIGVAAATLVVLSLVAGLTATAWQARIAARKERTAREITTFLTGLFESIDPELSRGREVTVREILDEGARRVETEMASQPEVQAEMLGLLGDLYGKLGDYDRAGDLLDRALEAARALHGPDSPEVAAALELKGVGLLDAGDYEGARREVEASLALRRKLHGPDHLDTSDSMRTVAVILSALGDHEGAVKMHTEVLAISRHNFGERHPVVANDLHNLGMALWKAGRGAEGLPSLKEALAQRREFLGPDHPLVATTLNGLAAVLTGQGEFDEAGRLLDEALALQERVLGPDHPDVAFTLDRMATNLEMKGDLAGARPLFDRALELRRRHLGPGHPDLATSINNLGVLTYRLGDYAAAAGYFREALATFRETLEPGHPGLASTTNNLGMALRETGGLDEAERLIREARAQRVEALGEENPAVAQSSRNLGLVLIDQGRLEEAATVLDKGLALSRAAYPEGHFRIGEALAALGRLRLGQGRPEEARPLLLEAQSLAEATFGEDHPRWAEASMLLGSALCRTADEHEGENLLRRALAILEEHGSEASLPTAESRVRLALCLQKQGRGAEGGPLLETGLPALRAVRGDREPLVSRALRGS